MRLWQPIPSAGHAAVARPKKQMKRVADKRRAPKKSTVEHWRKLLMSNELRRSVMLRGVLGPKGKPGASAINDGVLSGHFDSLASKGSPMPAFWKKRRGISNRPASRGGHPLSRATTSALNPSASEADLQHAASPTAAGIPAADH